MANRKSCFSSCMPETGFWGLNMYLCFSFRSIQSQTYQLPHFQWVCLIALKIFKRCDSVPIKRQNTVSRTCKFAILSSPLIITELSDFVNLFYIESRKVFLQTLYHFLINIGMYFWKIYIKTDRSNGEGYILSLPLSVKSSIIT